jgi:hypothetical protein
MDPGAGQEFNACQRRTDMANIKHFADLESGETVEFSRVDYRGGRNNVWGWSAERNEWLRVTRKVEFKSHPSRHECDARCMFARGRTMNCECSCGGKNHGKGGMKCD